MAKNRGKAIIHRPQPIPSSSGPVMVQVHPEQNGVITVQLGINYEKAPLPENYYVTDYFFVEERGLEVLLVFGKKDGPDEPILRNKIEIYFPSHWFVKQLWKTSRDFEETLRRFLDAWHVSAQKQAGKLLKAERAQSFRSNNVLMVLTSGECILDFYYIETRDLYIRDARQDVRLLPIVRVMCPPDLLLGLLEACRPVVESIKGKAAVGAFEDEDYVESNQV